MPNTNQCRPLAASKAWRTMRDARAASLEVLNREFFIVQTARLAPSLAYTIACYMLENDSRIFAQNFQTFAASFQSATITVLLDLIEP